MINGDISSYPQFQPGQCIGSLSQSSTVSAILDLNNRLNDMERRMIEAEITAEKFRSLYYAPGNPGFYEARDSYNEHTRPNEET